MRPGCFNVDERVRDMNAGGQLAGLNFPNCTGFSGQVLNQGPDRDVNLVMIKAYNDWHVDEWCGAYPGRFIPCGILPLFDVEEAAKEVKRLADKGCHAVTFSENPEALNMPSIHTKHWYPLFEAACENKTVLCTHVGSSSRSPMFSLDAPPSVNMTALVDDEHVHVHRTDLGRVLRRLSRAEVLADRGRRRLDPVLPLARRARAQPALRVDATRSSPRATAVRPTCSSEHLYTCFISDKVGVQNMEWFNEDMLCWESDFPHSDSNWPFAPEDVIETMGHLDDAVINKITHENAMAAYSFDPFTAHPEGTCAGRLSASPGDRRRRRHPRGTQGQPARPRRLGTHDVLRPGQGGAQRPPGYLPERRN